MSVFSFNFSSLLDRWGIAQPRVSELSTNRIRTELYILLELVSVAERNYKHGDREYAEWLHRKLEQDYSFMADLLSEMKAPRAKLEHEDQLMLTELRQSLDRLKRVA